MNKKEYLIIKELIDRECNKSITKPEYKEPIIFVHRNLKRMLKDYYKFCKTKVKEPTALKSTRRKKGESTKSVLKRISKKFQKLKKKELD